MFEDQAIAAPRFTDMACRPRNQGRETRSGDVRHGRPKRLLVPALMAVLVVFAGLATTAAEAQTFAYVANASSDTASVIDTATNTVTATVPVGDGPVGVAVTPDGARAYVTNVASGTVSVIATADNSVVTTVPAEPASRQSPQASGRRRNRTPHSRRRRRPARSRHCSPHANRLRG